MPIASRLTLVGSIGGYQTWLHRLSLVQRQLAVARLSAEWEATEVLVLSIGLAGAVPGSLLDENTIEWIAPTAGVGARW